MLLNFPKISLVVGIILIVGQVVCPDRATSHQSGGDGSIYSLVNHNVACNRGEALNNFQLYRDGNSIFYIYGCITSSAINGSDAYTSSTSSDIIASNERQSSNYLDRHHVNCKSGYVLQGFKLNRDGNKINYGYTCVRANAQYCRFQDTDVTDGEFGPIYYLDRQYVGFEDTDKALSGFVLKARSHNSFPFLSGARLDLSYSYDYCQFDKGSINQRMSFLQDIESSTIPSQNLEVLENKTKEN